MIIQFRTPLEIGGRVVRLATVPNENALLLIRDIRYGVQLIEFPLKDEDELVYVPVSNIAAFIDGPLIKEEAEPRTTV